MKAANRLAQIQEYYFSKKLKEVRGLAAQGRPIINMGIGSPDLQPPAEVITAIQEAVTEPQAHKYQSYQGLPELRSAIADFYKRQFSVSLDLDSEIVPLMGSKEGILHISLAFLNPGDQVLIPNPGYPTYTSVSNLVGASPVYYDLAPEHSWLPDLESLAKTDLSKVKLMWVSYPHMPTGAKASEAFFAELIAFAKTHKILVVNDNPYSFVLNDTPMSLLSLPGAKEVALELNSLSKSFNMAGWRVGMLLGKAGLLQEVMKVKTQQDSGMFYGVQKGAVQALQLSNAWFAQMNEIYTARRRWVWKIADALGCTYDPNAAGMFVWAQLPAGLRAEEVIDDLLYNKNIFVAPGTIFGSQGAGYIRFSLCVSEEKIKEALERL